MAGEKGLSGLKTAERSKPGKDSFDYRSANVEKWVQTLPVGNIGETARLVYDALYEVNRLEITWKERHRFLELLREPVHYVQNSLVRRFTGMPFPLPEKARRISLLARTLYDEMALGYKAAIEEMLEGNFLTRDNKALTLLIHRAVRYLSRSLLTCYQTYTPHPENSWLELHSLYLYAEHKNIQQTPIKDEYNQLMPDSSIARVYKQILLLVLTSPYRLRQGEAEAVYSALARWAGHGHIIPYDDPSAGEALFVVHMDSDEAPDYRVFDHRNCNSELCRLVDTRQLSKVLTEELERRKRGDISGPIGAQLMRLLIRTWGVAPRRVFSRNDRQATIEVVVGTTMLHRALARELAIPELSGKTANFSSKSVTDSGHSTSDDMWDIFSSSKMKANYEHYLNLTAEEADHEIKIPEVVSETWQIRNESAGGYRLALEPSQSAKVQVGELIGLRHRRDGDLWETGVVRWLRQDLEGGLEIGVQALAPQVLPVMVKKVEPKGHTADYQYGLMLPKIPTLKQPATIITPVMLFHTGDELILHSPDNDLKITLLQQLQATGSFAQFLFTPSRQESSAAGEEAKGRDPISSVWEDL
ncbi:MAG: hypothetical protein R6X15_03460 [Pseudomonadota bacterium]